MRRAAAKLIAAALFAAAVMAHPGAVVRVQAMPLPCASAPGHAAVVVEHGDGTVRTACVGFAGTSISGMALLDDSGIEHRYTTSGGVEVCQVDNEPASYPSPCLTPSDPWWWNIWVAGSGGSWKASEWGISQITIPSGGALGLHFVDNGGSPPSRDPVSPCASGPSVLAPGSTPAPAPASPPAAAPPASPRAHGGSVTTGAPAAASAASSATPAAASDSPATSPTAQVLAITATAPLPSPPSPGGTLNPALLAASLLLGALAGLLVVQVRRRVR